MALALNPSGPSMPATRRDFLSVSAMMLAAVGASVSLWPLIDTMNPAADTRAVGKVEIDFAPVRPGQRMTVRWRGRPPLIERRTPERIAAARMDDNYTDLIDPARVGDPEWFILIGVCTHLGCVPLGQRENEPHGPLDGWLCPCRGSVYEASGRVRRGPAPRNLEIPPYEFSGERRVVIG